jgi:lysozyme family protein
MSNFEACYRAMMRWEKGYADHPRDPGGKTMDGVTERVFHAWLNRRGEPLRPVRSITEAEKMAIYRTQYWDAVSAEELPPGLDLVVFDAAVNSGPGRAARWLQAALGVAQDGQIGNVTIAAAHEAYERDDDATVITRYMDIRDAFLRRLSTFDAFGKGWMNRTRDIRARAERMEVIEDKARAFSKAGARPLAVPGKPDIYAPDKAGPAIEPVIPVAPTTSPAAWLTTLPIIGTFFAAIGQAVSNPWALGAVALLVTSAGVALWAHKTGRLVFSTPEAQP